MTNINTNDPVTEAQQSADMSASDTNREPPGSYPLGPLADMSDGISHGAVTALDAVYECLDAAERAGAVVDFCAEYEPNDQLYADLLAHKAALALYVAIANRIDAGGNVVPVLKAALDAIHSSDQAEAALNEDILSRPLEVARPGEQAAQQ